MEDSVAGAGDLLEIQELDVSKNPVKFTKAFLETFLGDIKLQFDSLKDAFIELKTSVSTDVKHLVAKVDEATEIAISAKAIAEANTIAIAELKNEIKDELKAEFEAEIIELRTELKDVKQKYQYLDRENEDRKRHTNNIEMYSRRDNIVFYGIHEEAQECTSACARKFMVDILKIPQDRVDAMIFIRCHRLQQKSRTRPIIVRFKSYDDREFVWGQLKHIPKNKGYFMTEDYPKSVAFNRKKMLPIFYHARKSLGKKDVSLKGDVLIISGEKYTTGNLTTLPGDLHLKCFSRKQNDDTIVFGGSLSEFDPYSNWGKFPFLHNGITFPSLEHAYMYEKCLSNNNPGSAQSILECREPYEAKQIGDKVKITPNWTHAKCESVMKDLLQKKFSPGSDLAKELLSTGDKYIVESGRDKFYACGLSFMNKDIFKKQSHSGKNKLGEYLCRGEQYSANK